MDPALQSPRCLVVMPTKDEGAFLLEAIAWYRALGFEVMVPTNDCSDASPAFLDCLASHGVVHHLPHRPGKMRPKRSAYIQVRAHPLIEKVDWVLVCDVDEFLVLHTAATIQEVLGGVEPDFTGLAINWKVFGTNGHATYEDQFQRDRFTRCAEANFTMNQWYKSLFQTPTLFERFNDHAPECYIGRGPARWVNSLGVDVPGIGPQGDRTGRIMEPGFVTHAAMQMNHYILRTVEDFTTKKGVPDATAGRDRYTDAFFARNDRNEVEDLSALTSNPGFSAEYSRLWSLAGVAALHHQCCADRVARLCAMDGRDPTQDPRFQHHMSHT